MSGQTDDVLWIRLDERMGQVVSELKQIRRDLESKYVTRDQFAPVKYLVYGITGLLLTSVVGALVKTVVTQ